ncbi:hypothetical protein N7517_008451 [Penicillium concentricum]|uniref:Uncharacterized protein n=1 Tax=Penicillium concentricum TaxID=293559 RepID=A0A9W9RTW0_9EURO|nr:uncharacterized protein N7517_008451 [Penicillium concentricum]KAJ5365565.1 hypothetical protein N7517_008451 [Penicillium concentricum]
MTLIAIPMWNKPVDFWVLSVISRFCYLRYEMNDKTIGTNNRKISTGADTSQLQIITREHDIIPYPTKGPTSGKAGAQDISIIQTEGAKRKAGPHSAYRR